MDEFGENFGIDEFAEEEEDFGDFEEYDQRRVSDVDIITDPAEFKTQVLYYFYYY